MYTPAQEKPQLCALHGTLDVRIAEIKSAMKEHSNKPSLPTVLTLMGAVLTITMFLFGFVMAQFNAAVNDMKSIDARIRTNMEFLMDKVDATRMDMREMQTKIIFFHSKDIKGDK